MIELASVELEGLPAERLEEALDVLDGACGIGDVPKQDASSQHDHVQHQVGEQSNLEHRPRVDVPNDAGDLADSWLAAQDARHLERNRYWRWVVVDRALWATSRRRRVILGSVVDDRAVDIGTAQLFEDPGGDLGSVRRLSRVNVASSSALSIRFNISRGSLAAAG